MRPLSRYHIPPSFITSSHSGVTMDPFDLGAPPVEPTSTRLTSRFMTLYERAALIGERSKMLSHDATPTVTTTDTDPIAVARAELQQGRLPLVVRRVLPPAADGSARYEDWPAGELALDVDGSMTPAHRERLLLNPRLRYGT